VECANPANALAWRETEGAARTLGVTLQFTFHLPRDTVHLGYWGAAHCRWRRASLQASQHDINSKCCNLVGAFELSQCADCERPVLSSVPPTVKAVAAKQSAAFLKSARSDQAPGPVTKARFAQVARWLARTRARKAGGVPHSGRITAMGELTWRSRQAG
jgi:hypothetical protein